MVHAPAFFTFTAALVRIAWSRSVAVICIRSPSASSRKFERMGIVVLRSTTLCVAVNSFSKSWRLTLISIAAPCAAGFSTSVPAAGIPHLHSQTELPALATIYNTPEAAGNLGFLIPLIVVIQAVLRAWKSGYASWEIGVGFSPGRWPSAFDQQYFKRAKRRLRPIGREYPVLT